MSSAFSDVHDHLILLVLVVNLPGFDKATAGSVLHLLGATR